nr:DEAD/DEAH box helicase family protein [uncultured Schaedlerella sp.]
MPIILFREFNGKRKFFEKICVIGLTRAGSGKTLTSFKCAQLLIKEPRIKKVIFLVDRSDLDNKTIEDFNTYEKDCVDMTEHTGVLIKQLKGKDKLIVSTIQKMSKAIKSSRYQKDIEAIKDDKVIFIFDECHRSQAGSMHTDIERYFSHAQFFGFTGTPIFKENLGSGIKITADLFGKCLHQYLISNAIADRNVLGFSVEYIKT